jgi:hypothetical protein
MKTAALCLLLLCVLVFVPAAFADSITSITPSAFNQGDIEQFIEIDGTGLVGNVDTQVVLSGPFGTTTVGASPGANGAIFVSIPDFVLSVPGTVSVTVEAIDSGGTRSIGPGSFNVIPNGSSQPPLLSLPESITAEATSAAGANVSFTVSAQSFADSQPLTVNCDHTSGALYPVAITTVHCSATDAFGTTSGTFEINVSDTVPPTLHLPATIISSNPVVTYSVTATDNTDSSPIIFCTPASGSTFPVGTTTVQCTATDSHANRATGSFKITVTGGATAPVLTVPNDITVEAASASGAAVTFSATATDNATVTCSPASGATFPLGTTTVACSASTAGGTSSDTFHVTVVDTTGPVLTLPGTINTGATSGAGAVVTFAATATDLVDGSTPVFCNPPSGSTFPIGTTVVQCGSGDSRLNTASGSFLVIVSADVTPPVLTLPSNITAEATSASGAVVTYTASANDNVDGPVAVTCSPASGSTFPIGTTTVQCSATDAHGNTANGSFTVTVRDTTPPALALPANITAEATSASGAVVTYTASANDGVDGPVAVTCSPASGSTFPIGTTTVQCSASDAHSNAANGSFTVTVRDTTPPALALPVNITTEATSASGATATYTASATDLVDGVVPVLCDHASGSTFPVGTTTVQCHATDAHSNTASGSFLVTVRDTTPPTLSLPANITAEATSASGAVVSYTATATDIVDGSVAVHCDPASGSTFPLGTTTVQCTATDAHNNTAHGSFTVLVGDTTPPVIVSITASPNNLWPPNHTMVNVTVTVIATDLVDPAPTSHIVSVSSNQPINGTGDGDTAPDWVITGPLTLQLRSERSSGVTRVYTITIATTDASGNTSYGTVIVTVGDGRGRAVH